MYTLTILKFSHYLPTCLWRWNRQNVPKRQHIKFRCRGITQKKTYDNINGTEHYQFLPQEHTVNQHLNSDVLQFPYADMWQIWSEKWHIPDWLLHNGKTSAGCPLSVQEMKANNKINVVLYHPYSPDMESSDFVVFPKLKWHWMEDFIS
jgi:hypothetical protein